MASVQSVQLPADGSAQNGGSDVDPFLIEALQNARHRLTILRMELDIKKFLQKTEQLQFEFPHFPTSYLRLAAHRVAQHYGLQTAVLENGVDGLANIIVAMKTPESNYPSVCLSDIPLKQPENSKPEHVKITIRQRPCRTSSGEADELSAKRNQVKTVEERMEEYDKVRARIFSGSPECLSSDETPPTQVSAEAKTSYNTKKDETEGGMFDYDKADEIKDLSCTFSQVAIFRDREKDRFDPDYNRNYGRYVKAFPSGHHQPITPFNMPSFQPPPLVFYNAPPAFPQMEQIGRPQSSFGYVHSDPNMNQFSPIGVHQNARDAMYMQWPSPAMMYAHSYEPLRHGVFQPPFHQQPLSFNYSQNG